MAAGRESLEDSQGASKQVVHFQVPRHETCVAKLSWISEIRHLEGVSEGCETVWFQKGFQRGLKPCGFQSGLKPCDFRGVSEWSETVWLEGFQSGLKPCGFREVSESETVCFQRSFRPIGQCNLVLLVHHRDEK